MVCSKVRLDRGEYRQAAGAVAESLIALLSRTPLKNMS
jgi:hypothetical protein